GGGGLFHILFLSVLWSGLCGHFNSCKRRGDTTHPAAFQANHRTVTCVTAVWGCHTCGGGFLDFRLLFRSRRNGNGRFDFLHRNCDRPTAPAPAPAPAPSHEVYEVRVATGSVTAAVTLCPVPTGALSSSSSLSSFSICSSSAL